MIVLRTRQFTKKLPKLPPHIRVALAERLRLFVKESWHPLLNDHALRGERRYLRSINITGDYRLIYEALDDNLARLIDIDTHHNLYGS
ncbi:MAG: type II toxin-antitoxin system RelE/ParE family toxin [bacterium]|nr:type II toxin-antitoxin system RelE/ParE family toxin [bacterium]